MQANNTTQWIDHGAGNYEWTGDKIDKEDFDNAVETIIDAQSLSFPNVTDKIYLDPNLTNLPFQSSFKPKTINAPLATKAYLHLGTLEDIIMPNVEKFQMTCNEAAISINLPKAKIVTLYYNEALCNAYIPSAKTVNLINNDALDVNHMITTIENPQKIRSFI